MKAAKPLPGAPGPRNDAGMRHLLAPTLTVTLILSACAPSDDAAYPRLLPTDRMLAEPALPAHAGPARADPGPVRTAAVGRADALRARADGLRGPVVDPALRDRAAR